LPLLDFKLAKRPRAVQEDFPEDFEVRRECLVTMKTLLCDSKIVSGRRKNA